MRLFRLCLSIIIFISFDFSIAIGQSAIHPFSIHDMLAMDRLSDPQVSPDGKWIVFVLRETDLEANKGRTDLWLVGIDGKALRQFTTHPESDSSPRWAPDGKSIFFLSSRYGYKKLATIGKCPTCSIKGSLSNSLS